MTVSTVGYGDLAPTTPKTQAFVSVYAIVGLVLVWSIVSDYYGVVQGKLQDFQAKLLKTVGIELVDNFSTVSFKFTCDSTSHNLSSLCSPNGSRFFRSVPLNITGVCGIIPKFLRS